MKSFKMIFAVVIVSSVIGSQAFAQSAVRADERIKNPQAYRLGDSEDLQADQMTVDETKVCNQDSNKNVQSIDNRPQSIKRLNNHSDT
ncbi:MAG: hypothetical protein H7177_07515 [Rhizobacter sp.]|nr:hypothetical protein [Bacteriovorax sp.]